MMMMVMMMIMVMIIIITIIIIVIIIAFCVYITHNLKKKHWKVSSDQYMIVNKLIMHFSLPGPLGLSKTTSGTTCIPFMPTRTPQLV